MIDRHFQDSEARLCRPHLHLEVPAIGRLGHAEAQSIAPDGTKRARVRGGAYRKEDPIPEPARCIVCHSLTLSAVVTYHWAPAVVRSRVVASTSASLSR